ncbi:MAG TPA: hypothetical protein VH914_11265 [Acidimicrobiia bacterium]|nr:hypothetical protein [Acidimicrobiia bacterium]
MKRALARLLVGIVAATVAVAVAGTGRAGAASERPAARRLLVVSMPMVTWAELPLDRMPNLRALLEQSIVADLSVRAVDRHPSLGDAYVTISAGTRSKGNAQDGFTETRASGSIVVPAFGDIIHHNHRMLFNAHPGALGDALAHAGIARAVIGNADQPGEGASTVPGRQVADALATTDGTTPGGSVDANLLQHDDAAPYGVRIDPSAYLAAFQRAWTGRAVVMVEDSDLVRFNAAQLAGGPGAVDATRTRELIDFDALLGRMLASVDRARDAVLVMGPTDQHGPSQLTLAALRAPGLEPGLAESSFTRRAGFVAIVDIGPTIVDVFHVAAPDSMEGRPFERGGSGGSFASRRSFLIDSNVNAMFRDARIGPVTIAFIGAQVVLTALAAIAFTFLGRRSRRFVEIAALSLLGVMPATYLAALLPFEHHAVAWYWLFLGGVGVAIGVASYLVSARVGVGPLVLCLSVIVGLLLVDILTGARLQLNTVFGYSPTVGGRFAGIGNLAYSQLSAAALLLACLLAFRIGGRRGAIVASVLLGVAIIVDGMPMWGSDVGGVLSMVPAYGIVVSGLMGWRIRIRTVLIGVGSAVLALVAFTLVDLSRPKDHQTHLGRLVTSTREQGFHSFWVVIERKLAENFGVLFSSPWTVMVPIVLAGVGYIIWRAPGRLRALHERIPPMRWGLIALAVLAVLGFSLNDSGISIPGVMLGVLTPVMIVILVRADRAAIATPVATPPAAEVSEVFGA